MSFWFLGGFKRGDGRKSGRCPSCSQRIVQAVFLCLVALSPARPGQATAYYVDFSNGSDLLDGTSTHTAWKHSPGDGKASSAPQAVNLRPGDQVNFKGGVTYNGQVTPHWSGTSDAWITFQSSPTWGVGRAVFDGSNGVTTNQLNSAWSLGGNFILVSGFEIKDYFGPIGYGAMGVSTAQGSNCIYSNNFVHHIGVFPWNTSRDSRHGGQGVGIQHCSNIVVVSNSIGDCNYNGIGGSGGTATNLVFFGNEIYSIQNHGIQTWSRGFTEIAGNFFHDNTNGLSHSDSMQILSIDLNAAGAIDRGQQLFLERGG